MYGLPVTPDLLGVVGSHLYQMAGPDSDLDVRGMYRATERDLFSLGGPQEVVNGDGDTQIFELGKFISLLVKSNPTVLELLWLPSYLALSHVGGTLVENRDLFMTQKIRTVYLGFAKGQAKEFEKKRTAKSARHAIRVIQQGVDALRTGVLNPIPTNPSALISIGEYAERNPDDFLNHILPVNVGMLESVESHLPDGPDLDAVNGLLYGLRKMR